MAQRELPGEEWSGRSLPGHTLAAAGIRPGQWVLVEAFGDDDEMWLGKTEAFFGGYCCKLHRGGQQNLHGTRFNAGY